MITGILPYSKSTPIECSVRCTCGQRYLGFTGALIVGEAEARARERAGQMPATFVDSRVEPWLLCACGQALDFSEGEGYEQLM
jgi:hypothetical protein